MAEQLVAQAREKGIELVGPNGLLSQPTIVKKRQRRLTGVDQIVLSLSARGLTTGEISAHFAEVYGASVSRETVSKITDRVLEEMSAWMNRPLDEGRFPLVVANPEVKGFGCPGTRTTRCRRRSSAATSS